MVEMKKRKVCLKLQLGNKAEKSLVYITMHTFLYRSTHTEDNVAACALT